MSTQPAYIRHEPAVLAALALIDQEMNVDSAFDTAAREHGLTHDRLVTIAEAWHAVAGLPMPVAEDRHCSECNGVLDPTEGLDDSESCDDCYDRAYNALRVSRYPVVPVDCRCVECIRNR